MKGSITKKSTHNEDNVLERDGLDDGLAVGHEEEKKSEKHGEVNELLNGDGLREKFTNFRIGSSPSL